MPAILAITSGGSTIYIKRLGFIPAIPLTIQKTQVTNNTITVQRSVINKAYKVIHICTQTLCHDLRGKRLQPGNIPAGCIIHI